MEDGSAPPRARLGSKLRELRKGSDWSVEQVAEESGWHPSKVRRIESGQSGVSKVDLGQLLDLYGVPDGQQRAALFGLAAESSGRTWLSQYTRHIRVAYAQLLQSEQYATAELCYDQYLIPGLLQTEDYARAVISGEKPTDRESQVAKRLMLRMERREQVRSRALPLHFIVDEAVLHRVIGSRAIMAAQLRDLLDVARRDEVEVQVLPFDSAFYPGMFGAITILEFEAMPDLVYVESSAGDSLPAETERYAARYQWLRDAARSSAESIEMIEAAAAQHR